MAEMQNGRGDRRGRGPTPYQAWQEAEGIPVYGGSFLNDLYSLELAPWPRLGQRGAFANLADQEEDDGHVVQISPGGQTTVQHHLYESVVYVLTGRGATTFWQEGGRKQTVEWERGSVFAPPLNSS